MYKIKKLEDEMRFEFNNYQYYDFKVILYNEDKKEQVILPAFMTANFKALVGEGKKGVIEFAIGENEKHKKYITIKELKME